MAQTEHFYDLTGEYLPPTMIHGLSASRTFQSWDIRSLVLTALIGIWAIASAVFCSPDKAWGKTAVLILEDVIHPFLLTWMLQECGYYVSPASSRWLLQQRMNYFFMDSALVWLLGWE